MKVIFGQKYNMKEIDYAKFMYYTRLINMLSNYWLAWSEDDKADQCMRLCLDFLNKEGMRFEKPVYDEVQNIYDYFIEMGQNEDADLIWDLAKKMGLLLNKR